MIAGTLEVQLMSDVARIRRDMTETRSIVGGTMSEIDRQATALKGLLGGLFAGLGAAALANFIKGAIEGAARLRDLGIQAGFTVESLSGLVAVGKATQTTGEMIAGASNKLSKALATSNEESQGAARALKALGLDFDALQKMRPDERMKAVAVAMGQFEDGGQKSAAAMLLFGKAGAEMLPFLKDLATAGELHAKVTTAQAAAAHEFEVQLGKLKTQSEAWKKQLAMELLPTLNDILDALLSIKGTSDSKETSLLGETLITVFQTVAVLGVNIIYMLKQMGNDIGAVAAQMQALLNLNFSGFWNGLLTTAKLLNPVAAAAAIASGNWKAFNFIHDQVQIDAQNARVEVDKLSLSLLGILNSKAGAGRGGTTWTDPRVLGIPAKDQLTGLEGSGKAAKQTATEYESLIKKIQERIAVAELEIKLGHDATESEKFQAKSKAELEFLENVLTAAQYKSIEAALRKSKALDDETLAIKNNLEANKAQAKFVLETEAEINKALADDDAERIKVALAISDQTRALADSNTELKLEASLIGATDRERAVALGNLRIAIKLREDMEALDKNLAFNEEQRAVRRAQLNSNADTARAQVAERAALEEQITILGKVEETAHSVWTNIFDGGSNAFKKLGQVLKAALLDVLYQMTLKKWIISIGASLTGGVAAAGGSALSGAGLLGGTFGSFGAGLGAGFSALTGESGIMGAISAGTTAIGAGNIAGGLGTLAGALGPVALGLAAIATLFKSGGGPKAESGFAPGGMSMATDPAWNQLWVNGQRGDSSTAMQVSQTISQTYAALATQLGLLNKQLDVGVFIGKDPQGNSLTQLQIQSDSYSRAARLGGTENVGRSDAELQAAIAEETTRVIFEALKASDLPDVYKGWLNSIADSGGVAAMQAAIDHVSKAGAEKAQLEARLFDLTATDLEKLNKQREAERAAIDPSNASILEEIYRQQDLQKAAADAAAATAAAAGQVQEMSETMKRLTGDTQSLEVELLQALGRGGAAGALQRLIDTAGMTAAEVAVYDYNNSIRTQIKAVNDAAAAIAAEAQKEQQIANQRYGLETRVLQLQGNVTMLRLREIKALDESLRPLQRYIYALEDVAAAQDAATAAHAAVDTAKQALLSQYQAEESRLLAVSQAAKQSTDSLKAFKDSLLIGELSPLTPAQKYAETLRQFQAAQGSGDAGQIQSAATAFLEASRVYNASGAQYTSDFAMVQQALTHLSSNSGSQTANSAAQLAAVRQQITLLGGIDSHTTNITTALATYTNAIIAAAAADAAVTKALADAVIAKAAADASGTGTGTGGGGTSATLHLTDAVFHDMVYALLASGDLRGAYDFTKSTGRTLAQLDTSMGWSAMTAEDWAVGQGLAVYHAGINSVPRTGLALLEQGETVIPRNQRVDDTDSMVGRLLARVDHLTEVVGTSTRAQIQANFAANERAADRVVEGTSKATSRAAWSAALEKEARPT